MFGASPKALKPTIGERPGARSRTVVGNCFVGCGMIAKNPGDNWKWWNMLVERRQRDEYQREKDANVKQERTLRLRDEFQKKTDKKRILNTIQHRVEASLDVAYRDMQIRKEKLKQLFREEKEIFAKEFVERGEIESERKAEEAKKRADELRNQASIEEKKLVEEKRLQQYIEKSEQLRQFIIKKNRMEVKWAQEQQMKEHERIKAEECEMEELWRDLARREYQHMVADNTERVNKILQRKRENAEGLTKQKQEVQRRNEELQRQLKDEDKARLLKMIDDLKKAEEQERKEKLESMEQRRKDLDKQVKEKQETLNRLKENEKMEASVFLQYAEETWRKEHPRRAATKEQLRREAELFTGYREDLRKHRLEKEKELERVIQQQYEMIDKLNMEKKAEMEGAHKRLEEEVYRGRDEQLRWKHNHEEEERRLREEECKRERAQAEHLVQLQKELAFRNHMLKKQYYKDLQDQVEYQKTLKEREKREIERERQTGQLDEEHYLRLLKELEEKFHLRPHPFCHLFDGSAHLTEEEGRCRCPPQIELDPKAKTER